MSARYPVRKEVDKMTNIVKFFSGKKTYIVGLLMIALGYLQGNNDMILQGCGLIALRLGIAKK